MILGEAGVDEHLFVAPPLLMLSSSLTARVLARYRDGALAVGDVRSLDVSDDEHGTRTAAGGRPEEQILRQRLDRIADLARRVIERARVNPQAPASSMVEQLVRLVDVAEG